MNASLLLEQTRRHIQRNGQQLTVTRRPATQGGSATTQSIYFLPQPDREYAAALSVEGVDNAASSDPYIFVCAGDTDVDAATDRIAYRSAKYRITRVDPRVIAGVVVAQHCHAVKTGA